LATFDGPTLKTHYRPKDLAYFYRSRVIAYFVLNFDAISTGVGWEKISLEDISFATIDPKISHIFYRSRVIAHFVSNFVALATGVG